MRRALGILCGLSCVGPGVALASGGPVAPIQGRAVSTPGTTVSYAAIGAGRDTIVRQGRHGAGKLERSVRLAGRFGVAGVANDGSTTGLSADGRVLVLAGLTASYAQRRTTLVVLDTRRLVARARIALPGFYTVDAISPTGRWLYLIHYVAPNKDILRYEVRAYDVAARQLVSKPVIDPRDRGEAMLGIAITRAVSADGRWAYTLYARPGSKPFIHALDTARRVAVCVDLPAISDQTVFTARLALGTGGDTLRVQSSGIPIAIVNTRTFTVSAPGAQGQPLPARRTSSAPHRGVPWLPLGMALVALLGLALVRGRRSRTRGPVSGLSGRS
jgi:hypothetical protein